MTILSQLVGGKMRRCTGTCHKARKKKCGCICKSRYHGCGSSEKAQEMLAADMISGEAPKETGTLFP